MNRTEPIEGRSAPASYCICVDGEIAAARLSRRIAMHVEVGQDRQGRAVTRLTGVLANQAELIRVLMSMYEMGYTLVSLQRTGEPS